MREFCEWKSEENEQFEVTPHPAFSHLLPEGEELTLIRLKSAVKLSAASAVTAWIITPEEIIDLCRIQWSSVNLHFINIALPGTLTDSVDTNLKFFPVGVEGCQAIVVRTTIFCIIRTRQHVINANYSIEIKDQRIVICIFHSGHMCPIVLSNGPRLQPLRLVFSDCNETGLPLSLIWKLLFVVSSPVAKAEAKVGIS